MKFSGNSLLFFFFILNTGFLTILCRIPISRMSWLRESTEHVDVVTFYVSLLHSAPFIWKNPDTRHKIVRHHNYYAPTAYLGPNLTSGPSPIYLSFNLQREDTGVTAWLTDEPNEAGALIPGTRDSQLQHWARRLPLQRQEATSHASQGHGGTTSLRASGKIYKPRAFKMSLTSHPIIRHLT